MGIGKLLISEAKWISPLPTGKPGTYALSERSCASALPYGSSTPREASCLIQPTRGLPAMLKHPSSGIDFSLRNWLGGGPTCPMEIIITFRREKKSRLSRCRLDLYAHKSDCSSYWNQCENDSLNGVLSLERDSDRFPLPFVWFTPQYKQRF